MSNENEEVVENPLRALLAAVNKRMAKRTHMDVKDFWRLELHPLFDAYLTEQEESTEAIEENFNAIFEDLGIGEGDDSFVADTSTLIENMSGLVQDTLVAAGFFVVGENGIGVPTETIPPHIAIGVQQFAQNYIAWRQRAEALQARIEDADDTDDEGFDDDENDDETTTAEGLDADDGDAHA